MATTQLYLIALTLYLPSCPLPQIIAVAAESNFVTTDEGVGGIEKSHLRISGGCG